MNSLSANPNCVSCSEFTYQIRRATPHDAAALLQIYGPYVERTVISFETEVPGDAEFQARIAKALTEWEWLVAERAGEILGYAYATSHRARAAYRWSVEPSVYIKESQQRRGIGQALCLELFERLIEKGYCNAFAGITQPNESSVALHLRLGFEPIGVFRRVGFKFGAWHDVAWFQRTLRGAPPN